MQDDVEAELRGRLAMLETLLSVTIAQLAARLDRPDEAIAAIMANAEAMLQIAREQADPDDRRAADYAQAAFDQIGDAMERHLLARAPVSGCG